MGDQWLDNALCVFLYFHFTGKNRNEGSESPRNWSSQSRISGTESLHTKLPLFDHIEDREVVFWFHLK